MTKTNRIYYLDYIKVLMTIYVIMVHASVTFGGAGGWYYRVPTDFEPAEYLLTFFNAIQQTYFMGFFFFISGYFTPASYDKKGAGIFIKNRLIRLGIPLLIYTFLINPICIYIPNKPDGSLVSFILGLRGNGAGPLWFVKALLIFSAFYIVCREFIFKDKTYSDSKFPSTLIILGAIILGGILNFLVRLVVPAGVEIYDMQLGYFPMYIVLFIAGVLAYRNNWLYKVKSLKRWLWNIILTISILSFTAIMAMGLGGDVNNFMGGLSWQALFYSFWEPFVGIPIIFNLIFTFEKRFNSKSKLGSFLSQNAYAVYILHAPVLIYVSVKLSEGADKPISKFFIATIATAIVCYIISFIIRKIPGAKKIL